LLATEVAALAWGEPRLRVEVLVQIIKQITANPNPVSVAQGWKLMIVCLQHFPPSPDFDNYLEFWLRSMPSAPETVAKALRMV
jgi:hypothetical protein